MLEKGFLKPEISVSNLGKKQFWTGIAVGIATAFVLSYFFNYAREASRFITFFRDPFILTEKEFRIYDLFFATLSTSLGFGFTITYWLQGRNPRVKKRYLKTFTISNAWLVTFVAIMLVSRFGSLLPILVYGTFGYNNEIDILHGYWLLLVLIPIYIFLIHWNTIRLIFRIRYWMAFATLFYCLVALYLYKTTTADRSVLNKYYYQRNKQYIDFIDNEFSDARVHKVFFSDTTKQMLLKHYSSKTVNTLLNIKQAFGSGRTISLDTLILEKIFIHNMNRQFIYYGRFQNRDKNWSYALPEDIYHQILKHEVNSVETKELFEMLHLQVLLFTTPRFDWDKFEHYTPFEQEREAFSRNVYHNTETIQSRLVQVVNKLREEPKYKEYRHLLPKMEYDNAEGHQRFQKLNLAQ